MFCDAQYCDLSPYRIRVALKNIEKSSATKAVAIFCKRELKYNDGVECDQHIYWFGILIFKQVFVTNTFLL